MSKEVAVTGQTKNPQQDPAEGSRETIERELKRQSEPATKRPQQPPAAEKPREGTQDVSRTS